MVTKVPHYDTVWVVVKVVNVGWGTTRTWWGWGDVGVHQLNYRVSSMDGSSGGGIIVMLNIERCGRSEKTDLYRFRLFLLTRLKIGVFILLQEKHNECHGLLKWWIVEQCTVVEEGGNGKHNILLYGGFCWWFSYSSSIMPLHNQHHITSLGYISICYLCSKSQFNPECHMAKQSGSSWKLLNR